MSRLLFVGLVALAGLAGCGDGAASPSAPAPDADGFAADGVTAAARWTQRTRDILGRRGGTSNDAARTYALVSVAQYNAVMAAANARGSGRIPSESGAAAAASAAGLAGLYPAEQDSVAAALLADADYFKTLPSEKPADFAAGAELGRAVATAVLAYAATDGSAAAWTGTVPTGPGYWLPAPPPTKPSQPQWGAVRPWLLSSGRQFRPDPPPAFGSAAFLTDLAEVRRFSDTRTADQLRIAQFWAGSYGPGGPAGYFGSMAAQLATDHHLGERQAARILATLHMAIMDASIGCYEAKYTYWYIRPYQADAAITTPVGRPNFPSYPSAHSCLSGAAAGVLAAFFPAEKNDLQAKVEEAGMSRIYGGLHFRFDITAGRQLGEAVAALAVKRAPNGRATIPLE